MKEQLKLKIETVREKLKYNRNILLALLIGLVSSVYNLMSKIEVNTKLYGMIYLGIVVVFILLVRIAFLENDEKELIDKYGEEQ